MLLKCDPSGFAVAATPVFKSKRRPCRLGSSQAQSYALVEGDYRTTGLDRRYLLPVPERSLP